MPAMAGDLQPLERHTFRTSSRGQHSRRSRSLRQLQTIGDAISQCVFLESARMGQRISCARGMMLWVWGNTASLTRKGMLSETGPAPKGLGRRAGFTPAMNAAHYAGEAPGDSIHVRFTARLR